jgi:periplasmic protein TonB
MKRKKERVPEFDEIIFENRNKSYGAYDLRKKYKSVADISILSAISVVVILFIVLSFRPEKETSRSGPVVSVQYDLSKPVDQVRVPPAELKPPEGLIKSINNLQPKVVTDTMDVTPFIPITDVINATIKDGKVTDAVTYTEPVTPEIPIENKVFIVVEENPEFPGGNAALFKFISENLVYPPEAQENNIQGRVILKFVVNPDGSVDRIEVLKGVDTLLDNEAIRVVKTLPKFRPGKQGGVPVPVWFTLPILFKIETN